MATITLLSAKGSPGVSTLTVGLALAWPTVLSDRSALAVDADPAGGDFAAGILGGALPAGAGIIPLATSRGVDAEAAVDGAAVHLREDGSARLIAGVPDSSRAGALVLAWDRLIAARPDLVRSSTDLLVDAGRVDLSRPLGPWVSDADLCLLVVRPTLPAVTAAHRFVVAWQRASAAQRTPDLELVIVDAASPYRSGEVAAALGLACRAVVPFDASRARVHSEGLAADRSHPRSGYARAIAGLADQLGRGVVARVDSEDTAGGAPRAGASAVQSPAPAAGRSEEAR